MKHTQGDNPMIELRAISEDNFRECLLLRASVENEDFVDPVTYSLAEAWVYYQDTRPFAIYSDDTIVGFVSMYVGEDNYQIINFLIDDAFQRKGYPQSQFSCRVLSLCLNSKIIISQRVEDDKEPLSEFVPKSPLSCCGT